jgi:very-short-patch-repair endonuclease
MIDQDRSDSSLSRLRERARVRARALRDASTDAERLLWSRLRDRRLGGYKFRRQHPVGPFFADLACIEAKLIVELDGGQHLDEEAEGADQRRTDALSKHGFHVVRFSNRDMLARTESVMSAILDWLVLHHPHPNPLPQAGEGVHAKDPT